MVERNAICGGEECYLGLDKQRDNALKSHKIILAKKRISTLRKHPRERTGRGMAEA